MDMLGLLAEGCLEAKPPTIWTDEAACRGRKRQRRERVRREEVRRKETKAREKSEKVAEHCAFPMFCGSGGSTIRLAKAVRAEESGEMRDENCTALWCQHISKSKC